MPRPPAKRGRPPRQNASSTTVQPSKNNDDQSSTKTSKKKQKKRTHDVEVEVPRSSGFSQETPVRPSHTIPRRQSSTKTRRTDQTPTTKQGQVHHGSVKSVMAGGHGARGRFSVGPKRADTSSLLQRIGLGTPAFESSMLNTFRPRPRQRSILQLMADDGSSDLEHEEDFLGVFEPEDQSTPLNLGKRKTLTREAFLSEGSVNLENNNDEIEDERIPESPTKDRTIHTIIPSTPETFKKRKIMVLIPPPDPSHRLFKSPKKNPASVQKDVEESSETSEIVEETQHSCSEQPKPSPDIEPEPFCSDVDEFLDTVEAIQETQHSDSGDNLDIFSPRRLSNHGPELVSEAWSEILAPPMSSPAHSRSPVQPKNPSRKTKKKAKGDSDANVCISTATLQANLMPHTRRRRRRLHGGGEFEVFDDEHDDDEGNPERSPTPELAPDEDELSYLPARPGRKPSRKRLEENKAAANRMPNVGNDKAKVPVRVKLARPSKGKEKPTYSRRGAKEQETVVSDETTHGGTGEQNTVSEELLEQARKFAEVDRWSIDFEDVEAEQGSSFR